jgi:hypothetical protein
MSGWKPAPCGVVLSDQIDDLYGADRPNDGVLGDASHQARPSDHNPQPPEGWVDARDIYDWRELNADEVMRRLAASRDRRILYVISHGRMCSSYPTRDYPAWTWRPYSGPNGHFSHGHVSFVDEHRQDTSPWQITGPLAPSPPVIGAPEPATPQVEDDMLRLLKRADDGVQYLIGPGTWRRLGTVDDATAKATVATARGKGLLTTPTQLVNAREYDLLRAVYVGGQDA